MIPLLGWGVMAGLAAFGGIVWWGKEHLKLRNGDTAYVPVASLQYAGPVNASTGPFPMLDSLAALGGLVKVESVAVQSPYGFSLSATPPRMAAGTAGKEVGVAVMVKFPATAAVDIERNGQRFANPEKT